MNRLNVAMPFNTTALVELMLTFPSTLPVHDIPGMRPQKVWPQRPPSQWKMERNKSLMYAVQQWVGNTNQKCLLVIVCFARCRNISILNWQFRDFLGGLSAAAAANRESPIFPSERADIVSSLSC